MRRRSHPLAEAVEIDSLGLGLHGTGKHDLKIPLTELLRRELESKIGWFTEGPPILRAYDDASTPTLIGVAGAIAEGTGINITRLTTAPIPRFELSTFQYYDYVVDAQGIGTHTALFGSSGAYQAALAAGAGDYTIFIGDDETAGEAEDIGDITGITIAIVSASMRQRTLTAPSSDALFDKPTSSATPNSGGLIFRNITLAANGATLLSIENLMDFLVFDNVLISSSGQDAITLVGIAPGVSAGDRFLEMYHCNVVAADLLAASGSSTVEGALISDCNMTLSGGLFSGAGGGNALDLDDIDVDGGFYTVAYFWDTITYQGVRLSNFSITHTGGNNCIGMSATSQNNDVLLITDIVYFTAVGAAAFINLGSNNTNPNDNLIISNLAIFKSVGDSASAAVTIDSDYTNVEVGQIVCTGFTTCYSGPDRASAHSLLSLVHTDTLAAAVSQGSVLVGNSTPAWAEVTVGAADTYLGADGTDTTFSTPDHTKIQNIGSATHAQIDNMMDAYNGSFVEPYTFVVASNGTTITGTIDKNPSGNLTERFNDGYTTLTSGGTVTLTAGSAISPKKNYIYVLQSNKGVLVASDSDWPNTEHIKVAEVIVQTAALVQSDGILANRNWNDFRKGATGQGHHLHAWERVRWEHSAYRSGAAVTWTMGSTTIDLAITAAKVYQMHLQSTSAFNTTTPANVYVVNDSGAAYTTTADIEGLLTDSAGGSMSNRYYNLVVWCSVSSGSEAEQVFINLPSGSYLRQADAENDVSGFDTYTIPDGFRGYAFLVNRLTVKHATGGGTFTNIKEVDLRGQVPNVVAGGGTSAIVEVFSDSIFRLFDEGDPTRLLAFQLSGITAGNTRTITAPDADLSLVSPFFTGHARVGSASAPTNTTAGDLTVARLFVTDAALDSEARLFQVSDSYTPGSGTFNTLYSLANVTPGAGAGSDDIRAGKFEVNVRPTANHAGGVVGFYAEGDHDSGAFNVDTVRGFFSQALQRVGSTTVAVLNGAQTTYRCTAGTTTTAVSLDALRGSGTDAGTITNGIGLRIQAHGAPAPNLDLAIQSLGGEHRFVGDSKFGANTAPAALLDLGDASPGDNFALLKFDTSRAWQFETDGADGASQKLALRALTDAKNFNIQSVGATLIFEAIATDAGGSLGFYGVAPAARPTAFTQTYATATKTHSNPTAAAPGDLVATSGGWGASTEANFDKIATAIDALVADMANVKQVVNQIIDDLQTTGLLQ